MEKADGISLTETISWCVADMASPANQQDSQAWYIAVQRYVATLSAPQRAVFNAPASADACLNIIIHAQGRKRGFTRLLGLIRPLIDPLQRFEGAIDVLMQTHGAIANPIWGPLRMAVTVREFGFNFLFNSCKETHHFL